MEFSDHQLPQAANSVPGARESVRGTRHRDAAVPAKLAAQLVHIVSGPGKTVAEFLPVLGFLLRSFLYIFWRRFICYRIALPALVWSGTSQLALNICHLLWMWHLDCAISSVTIKMLPPRAVHFNFHTEADVGLLVSPLPTAGVDCLY